MQLRGLWIINEHGDLALSRRFPSAQSHLVDIPNDVTMVKTITQFQQQQLYLPEMQPIDNIQDYFIVFGTSINNGDNNASQPAAFGSSGSFDDVTSAALQQQNSSQKVPLVWPIICIVIVRKFCF